MSEPGMSDGIDFERWLAAELQRPVAAERLRVERVMARVRAITPPRRRIARDGMASPALAVSLAAALVLAAVLPPLAGDGVPAVQAGVRDTTRLVRFVLAAPDAARVAALVDARLVTGPRHGGDSAPDSAPDTSLRTASDTTT